MKDIALMDERMKLEHAWQPCEGTTSPDVIIGDDIVIKRIHSNFDEEVEKLRALHAVAREAGFLSPEILEIREPRIVLRRILFSETMYDVYIRSITSDILQDRDLELFAKCGEALAHIHGKMKLSRRDEWRSRAAIEKGFFRVTGQPLDILLKDTPKAFHHCDFVPTNLGVCPDPDGNEDKIVVFDPSMNAYSSSSVFDYGSIYVDIGTFVSNLAGRIPIAYYFMAHWNRIDNIRHAFLQGYERVSGLALDDKLAQYMGYAIAYSHFDRYGAFRREVSMKILYNSYKKNIPPRRRSA